MLFIMVSLILALIVGLIIGSFLNVVIARYPIMLESQWRRDCQNYLNLPMESQPSFNLWFPRSRCPRCKTPLKARHNIPILSYLWLKGRCAFCNEKIHPIYPGVEALTALLTVWVVWHYSLTRPLIPALFLTWVLIALTFIDWRKQILPDALTLTTLWIGLFLSLFYVFVSPHQAVSGAIVGYGLLWIAAGLFKLIRKKEGMGHGDFKMLGMLGAWFGVKMVLNILLMAILIALVTSIVLILMKKITAKRPIPFGPFIAIAGWVSMMTGPELLQWLAPYWV